MAQYVMQHLCRQSGRTDIAVDSCATSYEEIGNPVYPPARAILQANGIPCGRHTARRLTTADYQSFDYIIGMTATNVRNIMRIIGSDPQGKIYRLLDFASGGDIDDPWYSGDFQTAYNDILLGCRALLESLPTNR